MNLNGRHTATHRDGDGFTPQEFGIAPLDILKMRPLSHLSHSGAVDPAVGKSYQGGRYPLLFKGSIRGPGLEPAETFHAMAIQACRCIGEHGYQILILPKAKLLFPVSWLLVLNHMSQVRKLPKI